MKKQSSQIDIEKVAKLANLALKAEEKATFQKQLEEIINYVSQLGNIDTDNVEPIGHITGLENITRSDEAGSSLSQEDALLNAPKTHNGFFKVDAILEE